MAVPGAPGGLRWGVVGVTTGKPGDGPLSQLFIKNRVTVEAVDWLLLPWF